MNKKNNKIINNLKKKISYYDYNYYIKNKSIISDYKYDLLFNKLMEYKKKYPFLIKENILKNIFNNKKIYKIKHIIPMLSINSVYNINNIIKYNNKINKLLNINNIKYCCEYKIDGLAINLLYINGILYKASTRGDGYYGENVINNIKYINGIKKYLLFFKNIKKIEIRGEIFIFYKDFQELNKINKKKFSNPRNTASGLLRNNKLYKYKKKYLSFICYGYGYIKNNNINSQYKIIKYLNNEFKIKNKIKLLNNINEVNKYINIIEKNKNKINIPIDGIVIKIDSIKIQNLLGNNNDYPKWCIAYKFNFKNIQSIILNIKFNIKKNGSLIPIAIIKSFLFNGILIKNINLYNINYILKNNIKINDYIYINVKSGIIPKIIKTKHNINSIKIEIPNKCISCNNYLNNKYLCLNKYYLCKLKLKAIILNLISKNGFNISNIGNKIIELMINNNIINRIYDIFYININDLIKINIKYKISLSIINSINKSKNIKFNNFIYSLNIESIGKIKAIKLSNIFKNIKNLININNNINFYNNKINYNELNKINNFFNNIDNIYDINKLINIINIIYI